MIRRLPRWAWALIAATVLVLAGAALVGPRERQALFAFVGRFHPALVHLPIGALVVAAVLVALARSGRLVAARPAVPPVLTVAAVGAIGAVVAGQGLASDGGYGGSTLDWHRWLGYSVAVLTTGAAALAWWGGVRAARAHARSPDPTLLADGVLAVGVILLAITGHLGGTLTHGEGYITERLPAPFSRWFGAGAGPATTRRAQPSDVVVYETLVAPILEDHCVSCHGPGKANGSLRLDTPDHIKAGGSTGMALVAGQAAASDMIRRLWLPPSHKDAMPPKSRPAMPPADASVLRWWIDQGASFEHSLADVEMAPDVMPAIQARVGDLALDAPALVSVDAGPLDAPALAAVQGLGLPVHRLSEHVDWLQVSARGRGPAFGDAQLEALLPVATHVLWMDLGGTALTDTGASLLTRFPHLTRLHLDRTAITDAGLDALRGLEHLEYVNVFATTVTDAGLGVLQQLSPLRVVYLWQTETTPEGIAALRAARPTLEINTGPEQPQAQARAADP